VISILKKYTFLQSDLFSAIRAGCLLLGVFCTTPGAWAQRDAQREARDHIQTTQAGVNARIEVLGKAYTGTAAADGSFTVSVPAADIVADSDSTIDGSVSGTGGTMANAKQNYAVEGGTTPTPPNTDSLTALTIEPITGDNVLSATEQGQTSITVKGQVTGKFAAGDVVTLVVGGQSITATVGADGSYVANVPVSAFKADADLKIEGSVKGTGGDTATAAQTYTLENTDTPVKTALAIDPITADNIIGVSEATGEITVTGKVTGKFSAGDTVTLTINGKTFTTTAAADGSFSTKVPATDLLADADTTVDGRVTGTGGTAATAVQNYGIDPNVAPVDPVNPVPPPTLKTTVTIDAITGDNLINASELASANTTVSGKVTGAFAAGDKVNSGDKLQLAGTWTAGATPISGADLAATYGSAYGFVSGTNYVAYTFKDATVFMNANVTMETGSTVTPTSASTVGWITESDSVADLFGPSFTDANSGQTFKGVAVVGNASGYQYSTNGGSTWTNMPTVSDASALFLAPDALIRYNSAAGTAPANLEVRLVDSSGKTGTASLSSGQTVNASVNGGGTAFSGSKVELVFDTTAPTAPQILSYDDNVGAVQGNVAQIGTTTDDTTPTLKGTAEAGSTVKLYTSAGVYLGETVATNGTWTFTPTTPLAEGVYNIVATATDAAGNVSATGSPFNVTVFVNDAPVNTIPSSINALEDTATAITGLSVSDDSASLTVTLSVQQGVLAVSSGTGVTLTGSGSASVTLTGSPSAINTLLASTNAVTYTPTANYNGTATLTMLSSDGEFQTTNTTTINVAAVNDQPQSVNVTYRGLEDAPAPTSGTLGVRVGDLENLAGKDVDNTSLGIAITGQTSLSTGTTLYYSTNGGSTWNTLTASNYSDTNALLLNADARLYLVGPANTAGTLSKLSIRLWDGTDGATSGSTKNISGLTGASGAYSATTTELGWSITNVNDAPTLSVTTLASGTTYSGSPVTLFSNAAATVGPSEQSAQLFVAMRVSAVYLKDGVNEKLSIDGTTINLTSGTSVTTAGGWTANVSTDGSGYTYVDLTHSGASASAVNTLINGIQYTNTASPKTTGVRDFQITTLKDNGGTANGGVDTVVGSGWSRLSIPTAPIVLDLDRDGQIEYTQQVMDVNTDGKLDFSAWAAREDGVLVWDKYGNGLVTDHSQYAFTQYGGSTDLEGLRAGFDSNGDGVFDAADEKFAEFGVWQDADGDGTADAGELRSLADVGIASIDLQSDGVARSPADGVTEAGRTEATLADGSAMLVADAAFTFNTVPVLNLDAVLKDGVADIADGKAELLKINLTDLLQLPTTANGQHVLQVNGDAVDAVELEGLLDGQPGTWSNTSAVTQNGHTYNVYQHSADPSLQVLIDQHIATSNVHSS